MISVVSVINKDDVARDFLLRGLCRQNAKYELLLIDNRSSTFKSAAQAYNQEGSKAVGDYLMFVHQDVFLPSKIWLREVEDELSTASNLGIAGVAGMIKPLCVSEIELLARYHLIRRIGLYPVWFRHYGRGLVFQGLDKSPWMGKPNTEVTEVQTLDELLLIVPAKVFEREKFDESTVDDWHLYGVDFSLEASKRKRAVISLPLPVFHRSTGWKSMGYSETLVKIANKHRHEGVINTTMGLWPTNSGLLKLELCLAGRRKVTIAGAGNSRLSIV